MKDKKARRLNGKITYVIRKVRTPKVKKWLIDHKVNLPVLANETRWASERNMVVSFNRLRPFYADLVKNKKFGLPQITEEQWQAAKDLENILELPYQITMLYQEC